MAKRPAVGRPPAGVRPGEKSSDYHQLTLRMPPESVRQIDALAFALKQPRWRLVALAVAAYVREGPSLSDAELRAVRAVLKVKGGA